MATNTPTAHILWEEKVQIEPDLGDQRQSTYKALPSPPKTPKRIMMKYRFSGLFPLLSSLATFVLALVVVLAGQNVAMFESQYLAALNMSRLERDIIVFEVSPTTSLSAKSTVSRRLLDHLNLYSKSSPPNLANPDSPLDGSRDTADNIFDNLINVGGDGLEGKIHGVVDDTRNVAGVKDFYYVYLQKICSGTLTSGDDGNADGIKVDSCSSWEDVGDNIRALSESMRPSLDIGQIQVPISLLGQLASFLKSILDSLGAVRRAIFAFLIITLVGSVLSAMSILPAIYFPQSRVLIYSNIFWSGLATTFAFVAAILFSAIVVSAGIMNKFSDTIGVTIRQGGTTLLFVWLSFAFVSLSTFYWVSVWFVETRKSSFVKRRRDEDEIGHWRGIGKEVWSDLKGKHKKPFMRPDI